MCVFESLEEGVQNCQTLLPTKVFAVTDRDPHLPEVLPTWWCHFHQLREARHCATGRDAVDVYSCSMKATVVARLLPIVPLPLEPGQRPSLIRIRNLSRGHPPPSLVHSNVFIRMAFHT